MLSGYISLFTDNDLERIYNAALEILSKTGIRVHNDTVLGSLERFGASVDRKSQIAKLPLELVKEVVKMDREKEEPWQAYPPETGKIGLGNEEPHYYDWTSKTKRRATRRDMINMIKLGEVLDEISGITGVLTIGDVDQRMEVLYNRALLMEYTSKEIYTPQVLFAEQIKYLVELAEIYSGEKGDTRWIDNGAWITSPLSLSDLRCRVILESHKYGVCRFAFGSQAISGLNAPVTRAGTISLVTAELLGGWVIGKAIDKDSSIGLASVTGIFDMRTGRVSFSCPEAAIQDGGVYQLFRKLFSRRIGAGSWNMIDAKIPGFQAVHDKILLSMAWGALTTNYFPYHNGILDQGQTFSPTQLVIDLELNKAITQYVKGIETNDDALCLDLIKEIGHADEKKYLTAQHTLKNYKGYLWTPELIPRTPYEGDEAETKKENRMLKLAEGKWRKAILKYEKPKMSASKRRSIKDVLKRAEKEFSV